MKRSEATTAVATFGWLAGTPETFRSELLTECDLLPFKKGARVFDMGDASSGLLGLASGRFAVTMAIRPDQVTTVHISGAGHWIGDIATMRAGTRRIGVEILEDSWCWNLSQASFDRLLAREPAWWQWIARLSAINTAISLETVAALSTQDPTRKVAKVLLRLRASNPIFGETIPTTQSELAMMSGLSRSAISKALQRLAAKLLVSCTYGNVVVLDLAGLRTLSDG